MFTNIILPTDGSDVATRAVGAGIELAKRLGAKVTIVTVVTSAHLDDSRDRHAAQALAEAAAKAEAADVSATKLTRTGDDPASEIIAATAEAGGDLIVMASHGRSGLAAALLGSQTERVMKQSKVPVLVYR